jgi:hypothetical protein
MQKGIAGSLVALALALGILGLPGRPSAAYLAPSKASQVVMLNAFGTCPSSTIPLNGSVALAARIGSDGSTQLNFVVPPKQSLVLTSFWWRTADGVPNGVARVALAISNGTDIADVLESEIPVDAAGRASRRETLTPGIILKLGFVPCLHPHGGFTSVLSADALGFLVKDK